jgi:hypothetical protein
VTNTVAYGIHYGRKKFYSTDPEVMSEAIFCSLLRWQEGGIAKCFENCKKWFDFCIFGKTFSGRSKEKKNIQAFRGICHKTFLDPDLRIFVVS